MNHDSWTLGPDDGELTVRTGVAGRAARMGHRLTIVMQSWRGTVDWSAGEPTAVRLHVDVDSLQIVSGEGGVTPLAGPEKSVARGNALKSLDAKRFPAIEFASDTVTTVKGGYLLSGQVEIHGVSQDIEVTVVVGEDGGQWQINSETTVSQSAFGVRPYSLMMGAMKVADEVTVSFSARAPKAH